MKKWTSKYFYGNEISEYGLQNGYVDFKTLAKCGDMVLCNDITKLFYNTIGNDYIEPNQVNGYIDNSEEIEKLQEQIDELQDELDNVAANCYISESIQEQIDELQEQINDLEYEQDTQQEIFQYYIIDDRLAEILQEWTNEIVYYIEHLDIYVWGITHWGTSWDYVLTNIKIDLQSEEE
jgi:hypothetical protein